MPETLIAPEVGLDADRGRLPLVIVDDAHVSYRVYASGKRLNARETLVSGLRGGRALQTVQALRGVSFTASEGETIGVVGHNGSGKSTLFRAMSGLLPTSEGTIWARERPVLLGVNAALVPDLSGEHNIKLGLLAMGFTAEEAAARVDEIADFAELHEFIHHPMRTYSSGMGARLRFAIASARAHSILLIDEALAVGDRRFKQKSEQRIRELRESAGLVMIVSHSVGALKDACDRVLWIHKGELVADGPATEVLDDYVHWTSQPGSSAVGAAAPAKKPPAHAKQAYAKARPASVQTPVGSAAEGSDAVRASAVAELDDLLRAAEATAAATTASAPARGGPSKGAVDAAPPTKAQGRDALRRSRHRRGGRERRRRRLIAGVIAAGVVLLAAAAGAMLAILSSPAVPAGGRAPSGPVVPEILEFAADATSITCATSDEVVPITLRWDVTKAAGLSLTEGPTGQPDALPIAADLPAAPGQHVAQFSCAEEGRSYALIATGGGGEERAFVTITRAALPADTPESPESEVDDTPSEPDQAPTRPRLAPPRVPAAPSVPSPPASSPQPGLTPQPTEPVPSQAPVPVPSEEPAPPSEPPVVPDPVETAPPADPAPGPGASE